MNKLPFSSNDYPYCPVSESLTDIIEYFSKKVSFTRCKCTIYLPEKTISAEKPLQGCLYSLMGLRMATSACPFLSKFKPMARFHEPFSTPYYTVYRAISLSLLDQYFKNKDQDSWKWNAQKLKDF